MRRLVDNYVHPNASLLDPRSMIEPLVDDMYRVDVLKVINKYSQRLRHVCHRFHLFLSGFLFYLFCKPLQFWVVISYMYVCMMLATCLQVFSNYATLSVLAVFEPTWEDVIANNASMSLQEALQFAENFSVVPLLIPRHIFAGKISSTIILPVSLPDLFFTPFILPLFP